MFLVVLITMAKIKKKPYPNQYQSLAAGHRPRRTATPKSVMADSDPVELLNPDGGDLVGEMLPFEVAIEVLDLLSYGDLCVARLVNKAWR